MRTSRGRDWSSRRARARLVCYGLICGGLCLGCFPARSALQPVTARSQSGQFVVRGLPFSQPLANRSTSAVQYLQLDPGLTAVSLERIRYEVVTELGLNRPSQSLIRVNTHPLQGDDIRIRLASLRFNDGWTYQLELPELIDRRQFFRAAVQVVLQELANRKEVADEAPLPPWLVEGLAAQLQASLPASLALEMDKPGSSGTRYQGKVDPLQDARALLRQQSALNFDQLCLPADDEMSGGIDATYQACAQVFVCELLRLRDGRRNLGDMLLHLHENLNWQTTFLRSFRAQFPRLLDADKWYSVGIAHFSAREPMSIWPVETTLAQLDEVLLTTVQVRASVKDLPMNTTANLQRILSEWEFSRQLPVLSQKIHQVRELRLRGAPEVAGLINGYLKTLENYLEENQAVGVSSPAARSQAVLRSKNAHQSASRGLDSLDAQRETMRLRIARTARAR